MVKPQGTFSHTSATEMNFLDDSKSINISQCSVPLDQVLSENDARKSEIFEPDVVDKVSDLLIKEGYMIEFQLESSEALEDVEAVDSDDECPLHWVSFLSCATTCHL